MSELAENYGRILDQIGEAALRTGRQPSDVRLLGVTKRVDADRILEAIGLGLNDIGENRVQEAQEKRPRLESTGVRFHLIGHLQSNKASKAVELFDSIQSLDSCRLARRLDSLLVRRLPVFAQVHAGDEAHRSGVEPSGLAELLDCIRQSRWLDLRGLMTIPPYTEDPDGARPYFRQLRELGESHGVSELSMGMSHDFLVAIEEGATLVRIGTALFGARR